MVRKVIMSGNIWRDLALLFAVVGTAICLIKVF